MRRTRNRPHRFVLHMDCQAELGACVHGRLSTLNSQLPTALRPCLLTHPFRLWASGRRSPATGRCLPGRVSPVAGRGGRQDKGMNRPRRHRAPTCSSSLRSLRLCGVILIMALKMKKSPPSPLECILTRKCARKSCGCHSYRFKGLKLPWNDILTKNTGGTPPCRLWTLWK